MQALCGSTKRHKFFHLVMWMEKPIDFFSQKVELRKKKKINKKSVWPALDAVIFQAMLWVKRKLPNTKVQQLKQNIELYFNIATALLEPCKQGLSSPLCQLL